MSEIPTKAPPAPAKRPSAWFPWTLITVGGLVAALCGGVSMFLGLAIFLSNDMSNPDNVRWLLHYVLLGGVPALIGFVVLGIGIWLLRRLERRIVNG